MADNIKVFEPGAGRTQRMTDIGGDVLVPHVHPVSAADVAVIGTHDSASASAVMRAGAEARSSAPTPAGDGDDVRIQATTSGVLRTELTDPTGQNSVVGQAGSAKPTYGVMMLGNGGTNAYAPYIDANGTQVFTGPFGHGTAAGSGNPSLIAIEGRSTLGTPVDDGDQSRPLGDLEGRAVTSPHGPRGTSGDTATTLTGAADAVVAAGATGVRRDLTSITLISNGGTTFTLSDGTKSIAYKIAANTTVHIPWSTPKQATSTATAWTCTGTSGDIVDVHWTETKQ